MKGVLILGGVGVATLYTGLQLLIVRGRVRQLHRCDEMLNEKLSNVETTAKKISLSLVTGDNSMGQAFQLSRERFGDRLIVIAMEQVLHNIRLYRPWRKHNVVPLEPANVRDILTYAEYKS